MARDFKVAVDVKPVERGLREFARQVPFAVSYAMNLTARNAVEYMRSDIQRIFTIRNNWEALGITFKPASKRDLSVEIGSRHYYMSPQGYFRCVGPVAAYSHSASEGRRPPSHVQTAPNWSHISPFCGCVPRPFADVFTPSPEHPSQSAVDGSVHVPGEADWHASYCCTTTSYFPIRYPFANVTVC